MFKGSGRAGENLAGGSLKYMFTSLKNRMFKKRYRKIHCTLCGLQLHLDGQQRIISITAYHKECKGAGLEGSPRLQRYFQQQTQEGISQHSPPAVAATATRQPGRTQKPTPRRLHFPTELPAHEDPADSHTPAKAMTPSPKAGADTQADHRPQEIDLHAPPAHAS